MSAIHLSAAKFNGLAIRLAEVDGVIHFNANDVGLAMGVCNLDRVIAELLPAGSSHEMPLPTGHPDKLHPYLTREGAAALSKLSRDYETPKAFREWLKQDFSYRPEDRDEFDTSAPTVAERREMIAAVLTPNLAISHE